MNLHPETGCLLDAALQSIRGRYRRLRDMGTPEQRKAAITEFDDHSAQDVGDLLSHVEYLSELVRAYRDRLLRAPPEELSPGYLEQKNTQLEDVGKHSPKIRKEKSRPSGLNWKVKAFGLASNVKIIKE